MNIQRIVIVALALVGVLATFLPWYRVVSFGSFSGFVSIGWVTLFMFIAVIVMTLWKESHKKISLGVAWGMTVCSMLASFLVVWRILYIWMAQDGFIIVQGGLDSILGNHVTIGYGAWIVVASGGAISLMAFLYSRQWFRDF